MTLRGKQVIWRQGMVRKARNGGLTSAPHSIATPGGTSGPYDMINPQIGRRFNAHR